MYCCLSFCLYDHGDDNPMPNKRTVYISYLESVHFVRPRKMCSFIYHEILISYLDNAREKVFATLPISDLVHYFRAMITFFTANPKITRHVKMQDSGNGV